MIKVANVGSFMQWVNNESKTILPINFKKDSWRKAFENDGFAWVYFGGWCICHFSFKRE